MEVHLAFTCHRTFFSCDYLLSLHSIYLVLQSFFSSPRIPDSIEDHPSPGCSPAGENLGFGLHNRLSGVTRAWGVSLVTYQALEASSSLRHQKFKSETSLWTPVQIWNIPPRDNNLAIDSNLKHPVSFQVEPTPAREPTGFKSLSLASRLTHLTLKEAGQSITQHVITLVKRKTKTKKNMQEGFEGNLSVTLSFILRGHVRSL